MGAQFSSTEAPKQANWRPEEWLIDAVLEDEPLTFIDVRRQVKSVHSGYTHRDSPGNSVCGTTRWVSTRTCIAFADEYCHVL